MIAPKESHLSNMDLWKQWKEEELIEAKKSLIEYYIPLVDFVSNRLAIGLPQKYI